MRKIKKRFYTVATQLTEDEINELDYIMSEQIIRITNSQLLRHLIHEEYLRIKNTNKGDNCND